MLYRAEDNKTTTKKRIAKAMLSCYKITFKSFQLIQQFFNKKLFPLNLKLNFILNLTFLSKPY